MVHSQLRGKRGDILIFSYVCMTPLETSWRVISGGCWGDLSGRPGHQRQGGREASPYYISF